MISENAASLREQREADTAHKERDLLMQERNTLLQEYREGIWTKEEYKDCVAKLGRPADPAPQPQPRPARARSPVWDIEVEDGRLPSEDDDFDDVFR